MTLHVIGGFRLETPTGPVDRLRTRKTEALLLWLALHPRGAARPDLLDRFWPEDEPNDARRKLRLAIHSIRQAVGEHLITEGDLVRLAPIALDIQTETLPADAVILPGVELDWLDDLRRDLRIQSELSHAERYRLAAEVGDHRQAIDQLYRLLALETPDGQWYLALQRHYQELGQTIPARVVGQLAMRALGRNCPPALVSDAVPPASNLVGRSAELAELAGRLLGMDEPVAVGLVGPGGVGKSRLAEELREIAAREEIEVRWVTDPRGIDAQELPPTLIILDNAETLPDEAWPQIADWLTEGSSVRLLITSQRTLPLAGVHWMRLAPLPIPADDQIETLRRSEAVQLLCRSAELEVSGRNANELGRIARAVAGIPLALRLVGRQIAVRGADSVADSLHEALRRESASSREPRHRSLQASLSWSFAQLSAPTQTDLARLSAFRGGFRADSAQVISVSPETLEAGVDASWIVREGPVLRLLPPVRAFLQELSPQAELKDWEEWMAAQIDLKLRDQTEDLRQLSIVHAADLEASDDPRLLTGLYFAAQSLGRVERFVERATGDLSPTVTNFLGAAHYFLRDLERADGCFAQVEAQATGELRASAATNRGLILLEQERYADAIPRFEAALDPVPNLARRRATLRNSLASATMGAGDPARALELLAQVQNDLVEHPEAVIYLGLTHLNEAKFRLELGQREAATLANSRAMAIFRASTEKQREAECLLLEALIHALDGRPPSLRLALEPFLKLAGRSETWVPWVTLTFELAAVETPLRKLSIPAAWIQNADPFLRRFGRQSGFEWRTQADVSLSRRELLLLTEEAMKRL